MKTVIRDTGTEFTFTEVADDYALQDKETFQPIPSGMIAPHIVGNTWTETATDEELARYKKYLEGNLSGTIEVVVYNRHEIGVTPLDVTVHEGETIGWIFRENSLCASGEVWRRDAESNKLYRIFSSTAPVVEEPKPEEPKVISMSDITAKYLPTVNAAFNMEPRVNYTTKVVEEPLPHYYVATDGDDATGDGSMANPFASPFKAIEVMEKTIPKDLSDQGLRSRCGGGTVFIGDGEYRGGDFRSRLNYAPIRYGMPITIKAINYGRVTMKGSMVLENNWQKIETAEGNFWKLASTDYENKMYKGFMNKDTKKMEILNPQQIFVNGERMERLGYLTDKLGHISAGQTIRQSKIDSFKKYQMKLYGWTEERFNETFLHQPKSWNYKVLKSEMIPMQAISNFWEGCTRDVLTEDNPYGLYENSYETVRESDNFYSVYARFSDGINPNDESTIVEMSNKSFIMDLSKSGKVTTSGITFTHSASMSGYYATQSSGSQGAYLVKLGYNGFASECRFTNGDFSGLSIACGWNSMIMDKVPYGKRIDKSKEKGHWTQFLETRLLDGKEVPVKDMLTTVEHCHFDQNGLNGVSVAAASANILHCVFENDSYQPYENFWHSAATKYATQAYGVFANNIVKDVGGNGVWFDWCFSIGHQLGATGDDRNPIDVFNNTFERVGYSSHLTPHSIKNEQRNGNAMFFEVSKNGRFYNNTVIDTNMRGLMISTCNDVIACHNTIIRSGREDILYEAKERLSMRGHEYQLKARYSGVVETHKDSNGHDKEYVTFINFAGELVKQYKGLKNMDMWFDKEKFPSVHNITLPRTMNNVIVANNIVSDDVGLDDTYQLHIGANNLVGESGGIATAEELVDHDHDGHIDEGFEASAYISSWNPATKKFDGGVPKAFSVIGSNNKFKGNMFYRNGGVNTSYRGNRHNVFTEENAHSIEDHNTLDINPFVPTGINGASVAEWELDRDSVIAASSNTPYKFSFVDKDIKGNLRGDTPTVGAVELQEEAETV